MLFVGLFRMDRSHELDFWAVFWQGRKPPADFELVAAYNLMSDTRVIVFKAETIAAVRWLDKLNHVGTLECFPALDQTAGYQAVANRDLEAFAGFLRERGAGDEAIRTQVEFRETAMNAPSVWAALDWSHAWQHRERTGQGAAE